jgi:hypothetical protein
LGAYGSLSPGYDPGYLLRESSKGAEGYYLSAVDEIGEPPGVWTGRAGPALGLAAGAEVEHVVVVPSQGRAVAERAAADARGRAEAPARGYNAGIHGLLLGREDHELLACGGEAGRQPQVQISQHSTGRQSHPGPRLRGRLRQPLAHSDPRIQLLVLIKPKVDALSEVYVPHLMRPGPPDRHEPAQPPAVTDQPVTRRRSAQNRVIPKVRSGTTSVPSVAS